MVAGVSFSSCLNAWDKKKVQWQYVERMDSNDIYQE